MNFIIKGTASINGNASWMIPFGLFYIVPTIGGAFFWMLPESPRWLVQHGRLQKAREVLKRVRVDSSDHAIDAEILQLQLVLEDQKQQGKWIDLIRGTNLRRTMIVLGTVFFNQSTGQNFVSNYGAIFIKKIGTVNVQTMGIVTSLAGLVGTMGAMLVTDRFGRRLIFCSGGIIQSFALFTMAGLGLRDQTQSVGSAISAMVSIFNLGYGFGTSSVNHVITAEIPHQRLRDKTQRIAGWVNNLTK